MSSRDQDEKLTHVTLGAIASAIVFFYGIEHGILKPMM